MLFYADKYGNLAKCDINLTFNSLVLSGGGIKCIYKLGFLYGLNLNHIQTFVGVSSGAIVCFLLAIGYTPFEIFIKLLNNLKWLNHSYSNGLFNNNIKEHISKLLAEKIQSNDITFERLFKLTSKRLIVNAFNITEFKQEIFSLETTPYMSCIKALELSISIPLLFEQSYWNNNSYIDGGLVNNFPITLALKYEGLNILAITTLFTYYDKILYQDERLNVVLINDRDNELYLNASNATKFDMFRYGYLYKKHFKSAAFKRRRSI